jgi:helix-turn-helix protein
MFVFGMDRGQATFICISALYHMEAKQLNMNKVKRKKREKKKMEKNLINKTTVFFPLPASGSPI